MMKLPSVSSLIEEQRVIYEKLPDDRLFIVGPPGSGKTTLAILRAQYVRNLGQEVIIITKNRLLSSLAHQLSGRDIECRTMHSFVGSTYSSYFRMKAPSLEGDDYAYDWPMIVEHFKDARIGPTDCHVIIDEGQNLPREFFFWLNSFVASTATIFADEGQTTSDENNRTTMADIMQAGFAAPLRLSVNHRNTPAIANVAEHFYRRENLLPPGRTTRPNGSERPHLILVDDWSRLAAQIRQRYENRRGTIGVIVHRKKDVFEMQRLLVAALGPDASVNVYVSNTSNVALESMHLLAPGITVLSSESAIGLEFDTVYLQDLSRSLPADTLEKSRRMYMLCARARDALILVDGPTPLTADQLSSLPSTEFLER